MNEAEEILDKHLLWSKNVRVGVLSAMEKYKETKSTHGGHRPNSGRKKKPDTKTLSFRVAKDKADELKSLISAYIKSLTL